LVIAKVLIITDLKKSKIWIEIIEIAQKIDINSDKTERLSMATHTRKRQSANNFFVNNLNGGMEKNRCHIAENVETPIPDIQRNFRTLTGCRGWNMERSGTLITEIHTV
jgi:hypothetical protein